MNWKKILFLLVVIGVWYQSGSNSKPQSSNIKKQVVEKKIKTIKTAEKIITQQEPNFLDLNLEQTIETDPRQSHMIKFIFTPTKTELTYGILEYKFFLSQTEQTGSVKIYNGRGLVEVGDETIHFELVGTYPQMQYLKLVVSNKENRSNFTLPAYNSTQLKNLEAEIADLQLQEESIDQQNYNDSCYPNEDSSCGLNLTAQQHYEREAANIAYQEEAQQLAEETIYAAGNFDQQNPIPSNDWYEPVDYYEPPSE